ncbi:MAG: hypothetical protein ACRDKW_14790 [Actinomycetota bacterium]
MGLLTAETIARWLAAKLADGVGLVEEATVLEVLGHTEDPANHCVFLPRTATAFDALHAFEGHAAKGWSLDALVVTNGGHRNELPLALVTTSDIPTLLGAIGRNGPS